MNKDVVRRILAIRCTPKLGTKGPSWLTVLGHAKDSLWSVDLFRCESAVLRAYWVLVVMDQYTCRSRNASSQANSRTEQRCVKEGVCPTLTLG